jgi:pyridoxine kinase
MILAGIRGDADRNGDCLVTVISIQSQVVHGHVGNSAALFALQLFGIEAAAVPTVLFSNHPRYSSCYGKVLDAALVRDLLRGIGDRGLIEKCKILISGYLGSPEIAAVVGGFVVHAKARNPNLVYLCDPVMGDTGTGFYVCEELRAAIAKGLVPLADILTPNQFELESLAGRELSAIEAITAAARELGPATVAVTGVRVRETPPDAVQTLVVEPGVAWIIATPRLSSSPSGTGDLFAALFAAALVQKLSADAALGRAVSGLYAVLEETERRRCYETALVPSAHSLLRPTREFAASPILPSANDRSLDAMMALPSVGVGGG